MFSNMKRALARIFLREPVRKPRPFTDPKAFAQQMKREDNARQRDISTLILRANDDAERRRRDAEDEERRHVLQAALALNDPFTGYRTIEGDPSLIASTPTVDVCPPVPAPDPTPSSSYDAANSSSSSCSASSNSSSSGGGSD